MKKYTWLTVLVLPIILIGCEASKDKNTFRVIGFVIIGILATYLTNKRNEKVISQENNVKEKFEKWKSETKSESETSLTNQENEIHSDARQAATKTIKNKASNLVGEYRYSTSGIKKLALIGFILIILGVIFGNAGEDSGAHIPIYYHGFIFYIFGGLLLLLGLVSLLINSVDNYSSYLYKLYEDRIECYEKSETIKYVILLSDILKIDTEYKTVMTRGGSQIDRIFYLIKTSTSNEVFKIEVQHLKNIDSKRLFKDDLYEQLAK